MSKKIRSLSLVLLLTASALLANLAYAAKGSVNSSIVSTTTSGSTDPLNPISTRQLSAQGFSLQYTSATLANSWTLLGQLDYVANDYSQLMLRDERGNSFPLSEQYTGQHLSTQFRSLFQRGSHTVDLSLGASLTDDPYAFQAWGIGYLHSLFYASTQLGFRFNQVRQSQPEEYYIGRDLRNTARPRALLSRRFEFVYEQVLNEYYKFKLSPFVGDRQQDRPHNYGLELKQALALNSKTNLKLHLGTLQESSSPTLINERGRFKSYWAEGQITYEPIYDFLLHLAMGTVVEQEFELPTGSAVQLGIDTLGVGLSYQRAKMRGTLSVATSFANTDYRSQNIRGGLQWEI